MEVFSADITSWTASFRYPNIISGLQPTLEVPPISTVLGLLNAASGKYIDHHHLKIGYYFRYAGRGTDLETIYMNEGRNLSKPNVIRRDFLYENFLRIYLLDEFLWQHLAQPVFPLVLGRLNDLASVDSKTLQKRKLQPLEKAEKITGQLIPYFDHHLPGTLQSLPKYFTNTIPRQNIGTEPYTIVSHRSAVGGKVKVYRDIVGGKPVDVYFHDLVLAHPVV